MGEVQFAKQFLTTVDARSTKYQPDHVFNPKEFQTRIPYTLPRLSHPPHPSPPSSNPPTTPPPGSTASTPSLTIVLKSGRNPVLSLALPDLDPSTTTIHSLKESVQSTLGGSAVVAIDKIKILLNKKPVPSSKKTVAEALTDQDGKKTAEIEFGVMVMGGAPDPPPPAEKIAVSQPSGPGSENAAAEAAATASAGEPMEGISKTTSPPAAEASTGSAVLATPEFWDDLQGFLEQRIKDQPEAKRIRSVFEGAWKKAAS